MIYIDQDRAKLVLERTDKQPGMFLIISNCNVHRISDCIREWSFRCIHYGVWKMLILVLWNFLDSPSILQTLLTPLLLNTKHYPILTSLFLWPTWLKAGVGRFKKKWSKFVALMMPRAFTGPSIRELYFKICGLSRFECTEKMLDRYPGVWAQGVPVSMVNLHSEDVKTSWVSNSSVESNKHPQDVHQNHSAARGLGEGGHLWEVLGKFYSKCIILHIKW